MICKMYGKIVDKKDDSIIMDINNICYEVLVPESIINSLENYVNADGIISLIIYHYFQVEPSRSFPFLIGFLNDIEKEFFEKFITVSGIGPKAAVRAFKIPISTIAQAIDSGDVGLLRSLPGIGPQRAKEIIAKLQGKVGKFALMQDSGSTVGGTQKGKEDIQGEALTVLSQLQYKKAEAEDMIKSALRRNPEIKTAEELLNEVYKQRKS